MNFHHVFHTQQNLYAATLCAVVLRQKFLKIDRIFSHLPSLPLPEKDATANPPQHQTLSNRAFAAAVRVMSQTVYGSEGEQIHIFHTTRPFAMPCLWKIASRTLKPTKINVFILPWPKS